jgi:hypothetical protein
MGNANYYWSGNSLQEGSRGQDALQWQTFLKNQGYYTGALDGSYGPVTKAATKAYQRANGLTVDGIAGPKTMAAAGFVNYNTPVAAPTLDPAPTYTPHDTTSWNDTEEGKTAKTDMDAAASALTNYGDFSWDKQGDYDALYDKYTNRDPFSYDFNADALYQQYKDKYIQQGKMAMADTIGQASAMTGGYGNSYAATVGNQAYQASLQTLNDIVPELYQMAYDQYNQDGQDMLNMIGLMGNERDFAYGQHNDKYTKLANDRDYWGSMYNNLYNRDYTQYSNDRTFEQTNHNTAESYKYQADRDATQDAQWQAQFDETVKNNAEQLALQKE